MPSPDEIVGEGERSGEGTEDGGRADSREIDTGDREEVRCWVLSGKASDG